jgi:hypothetical protein
VLADLENTLGTANVIKNTMPSTKPKPFDLTEPKLVKMKSPEKVWFFVDTKSQAGF